MIDKKQQKKISKFLSLVLRHRPQIIGIELDENGWTEVKVLMDKMNNFGKKIDLATLKIVVENNDKQRYAFSDDMKKILVIF